MKTMNDFSKQMEMVLYRSEEGDITIDAYIKDETLWVTQKSMAELFDVGVPAVSKHLKNIFNEGELAEEVVVSKMEITTPHGAIVGKTCHASNCRRGWLAPPAMTTAPTYSF